MTAAATPRLFYTTSPAPCPYLEGKLERKVITELAGSDIPALHDRLSRAGFRRSHGIAYAPVCAHCSACIPIRLPVAQFTPHRTQRRIQRRYADFSVNEVVACATDEQYALFHAYQFSRHRDGDMAGMGHAEFQSMVEDSPVQTSLFEFRDARDRLQIVSLVDTLSDGLSAVYTFFDTQDPRASFGTYSILRLIEETRQRGLPYLYLGYWVRESPKMAYKSGYRPAEIMRRGHWSLLEDNTANT